MKQERGDSYLKKLLQTASDDELKNRLRHAVFSNQEMDMDEVDSILAELDSSHPDSCSMDAEQSWMEFQSEYAEEAPVYEELESDQSAVLPHSGTSRKNRSRRLTVLAAAVAAVVASLVIAQAAGANLLGAVARWTSEVFSFGDAYVEKQDEPWREMEFTGIREYDSMQQALDAFQIRELTAPTWLPEGYRQQRITADCYGGLNITAVYSCEGGDGLIVSYREAIGGHFSTFEKTGEPPEVLEYQGHTIYYVKNIRNDVLIWTTQHFECHITGVPDRDMILNVLNSITIEDDG